MRLEPFEVYCDYLALKKHFNDDKFDYFKYNGKLKTYRHVFDRLNDRYAFFKLSKHHDPFNVILSNMIDGPSDYIGDISGENGNSVYLSWLKRKESRTYTFKSELKLIHGSFVNSIKVKDRQHPEILTLFARGQMSIESLIIIDRLTGCFDKWNGQIVDPIYWPNVYKKCRKYVGFIDVNHDKMLEILRDDIRNRF